MPDMTLTKEDLGQIRGLVRDEVETIVRHELHKAVDPLFAAVQQDIQRLDGRIDELDQRFTAEFRSVRQELVEVKNQITSLAGRMGRLESRMDDLIISVDGYVKKTNDWHQEFVVLKARHNLLHGKLVEKGIVTDDELTLG